VSRPVDAEENRIQHSHRKARDSIIPPGKAGAYALRVTAAAKPIMDAARLAAYPEGQGHSGPRGNGLTELAATRGAARGKSGLAVSPLKPPAFPFAGCVGLEVAAQVCWGVGRSPVDFRLGKPARLLGIAEGQPGRLTWGRG